MLGKHAFASDMQIVKLAAGVEHAADFGDPEDKTGFVAAVVAADQLAFLVAQEVAGMLT